jgi:signal transduction histidine kinase
MRFRGAVLQDRLEPVMNEMVGGRSNQVIRSSELMSILLLNASGQTVASAGRPIDLEQKDIQQEGERWGRQTVTLVNPVDLGATVVLPPPPRDLTNNPEAFRNRQERREPHAPPPDMTNKPEGPPPEPGSVGGSNMVARSEPDGPPRDGRPRRPFWLRNMEEKDYQALMEKQSLHGLVLAMSTASLQAASDHDLWLRGIIVLLGSISVLGSAVAWRNLSKSADLQIRLIRASELTTHLREMNLAAAGLAHETRNPLNIIRGLAQMISRRTDAPEEIQKKSREIVDETDKVTAQLNEFINYSRPREVRRAALSLGSVVNEVVRALNFDLEEKKIRVQVTGEPLSVEADEQLLRQALFNLLLNAIQAVNGDGEIQVLTQKRGSTEGLLEVRDNGPGVPPERRAEIFKPYFTTQKKGTGLGLAVVQQIVLAHGWEIECLGNQPSGAVFRITHLKLLA